VLARRRIRTVIDNLLDRSRPILNNPPFVSRTRHLQATFALLDADVADRAATFPEISRTARVLVRIPQVTEVRRDRAPVLYSLENLRLALLLVGTHLPVAFTIGELDHIFRMTLPNRLPGVLNFNSSNEQHDIPNVVCGVNDTVLMNSLTPTEQFLIRAKVAQRSDQYIADRLGWTRRTTTYRKDRILRRVEALLGPLTYADRHACLARLCIEVDRSPL
jgi:hypothetical protein